MKFTTHFELHSQTTRLVEETSHGARQPTRHGILTLCDSPVPRNLGRPAAPKSSLQITTRTPETPDFKFELLPLHSQLLRQSLLVSFPPLIDMLKFSGYPCLIRSQKMWSHDPSDVESAQIETWQPHRQWQSVCYKKLTTIRARPEAPVHFGGGEPTGRLTILQQPPRSR